ncbi:ATP-binding protein [Marinobacterium zhoushanense]|uniref:ATP-binding protein n=1 Tax=Marinobacterium zhoushanense TaxID=1679163 RepID=A0ABQ1K883_9GAMM|nr:ATP-binding protein [Marinobacterium zhoushanense]
MRLLPEFGLIIYKEQFLAFFLTLCLMLTFMIKPATQNADKSKVPWYDVILILATLGVGGYTAIWYHEMIEMMGLITIDKTILSAIGLFVLLEAARRLAGLTMVIVALVALAYAFFGHYLSGMFETRSIPFERLLIYNFLGTDAVLGTPLYVAATIVTAFVLFGQVLFMVGGGDAISNFSFALMGKRRGGPAKVAVLSSALFGSLSGSASANVATTGMITIPMMKKVGYTGAKAGAIEAVASTGGLVLPPVMAATGFLMAEFLGVPYSAIAIAAAIPALLFYLCVYLQVDLEAGKSGISAMHGSEVLPLKSALLQVAPVAFSFAVLLYVLFGLMQSPESSAFAATAATAAISLLVPRMRRAFTQYLKVLSVAGEAVVFIAVMCAVAGLVVGCLGLTGLGSSLSQNLVTLAGGNVWLLLMFAAVGCIVLGMGVPVTATYIILVILVGPALTQVGVNELAAHMFVFYFGTLSFLTPPVCLAVFVAVSIAGSGPWSTAFYALRFAVIAYLIPFVFVFNDAFLMQGGTLEIVQAVLAGSVGVFLLSISLVGYWSGVVSSLLRLVAFAVGILAFWVGSTSWLVCLLTLSVLIGLNYLQKMRNGKLVHI